MKEEHIKYLMSDITLLMSSKGDKQMLKNFEKSLFEENIAAIDCMFDSKNDFFSLNCDEFSFEETEIDDNIFEKYKTLHFDGEQITKELWRDKVIPCLIDKIIEFKKNFALTLVDLKEISSSELKISIDRTLNNYAEDVSYTIEIQGDGNILLTRFQGCVGMPDVFKTEHYTYSKIVADILNTLLNIDFLSLKERYHSIQCFKIDDGLLQLKNGDEQIYDLPDISITVEVGNKFKNIYNYNSAHLGIACVERYIDDLVFNKLKRYTRKPRKCSFCESDKIASIIYGMPTFEAMEQARQGKFIIGGCCVTEMDPRWGCVECGVRFYKK